MTITFNPDGGDMGRSRNSPVTPLEFEIIVPHVIAILEDLYHSGVSNLPFKYAFEFYVRDKAKAELVIMTTRLPPHVKFYDCDGRKLFEIRGASGGIASSLICYLITEDK